MAGKPFIGDQQQRERRQQQYLAVPTMAQRFPQVDEITLAFSFQDPDGKTVFSPYKQLYLPAMQAYFHFLCSFRECRGGGFDLDALICAHLHDGDSASPHRLECAGSRSRLNGDTCCGLILHVQMSAKIQAGDAGL